MKQSFYVKYIKRCLDIILSGVSLIILSPLFLVIALLVRLKFGAPVIFTQKRPGKNGEIFAMYKFRTMTNEKDGYGNLLPDDQRLTSFGKMLRSTSLDELPELLNIFKGDMSIVGPRPQLVRDEWFMSIKEKRRHVILPGLTGWAQVNGRNAITWEKKFEYDLYYIEHISFLLDMRIILKTIGKVFLKSDISTDGFETAEDLGDYLVRNNKITIEEYDDILRRNRIEV